MREDPRCAGQCSWIKTLRPEALALPVPVTLTIGKQLCRALEVAHAEGVIHRDIKPQNMVVEPSGFLKVMDFGIACRSRRRAPGRSSRSISKSSRRIRAR
ncbi:MAG: protein kinase domain-containing protein [Gemmatimonadales bacterium]